MGLIAPPEGTIGLSTVDGRVGAFVKTGQGFMGASRLDYRWSHTFYVGKNGDVYQAMPNGMEKVSIEEYIADLESGDEVMFLDIPELTVAQRERGTHYAEYLVEDKRGYSFGTYLALFLRRIGFKANWLRKIIANRKTLICSGAVDEILTNGAGFHPFIDGRARLDVIPADFAKAARTDPRFVEIKLLETV